MSGHKILGSNRKAYHLYEVLDKIEAGIVLQGTEVKSLRMAHFNFSDAYASVEKGELWLLALHINPYTHGNLHNHEPVRPRKLLVKREELRKIKRKIEEKGLTLVPLAIYLKGGLIKVELGICRGKKLYDKRQDIKAKDQRRDADRDARHS